MAIFLQIYAHFCDWATQVWGCGRARQIVLPRAANLKWQSATTVFLHLQCTIPAKSLLCVFALHFKLQSSIKKNANTFLALFACDQNYFVHPKVGCKLQLEGGGSTITFAPL